MDLKENKAKIVFMGTPEFAVPSLDILVKNGFNVACVVTVPDKPQGRGLKLSQSEVKKYALEHNLPILQPEKLKDEKFIKYLEELSPDIIVVVAFRILPREVYSLAKLGAFNLHASLLPKYRGAAPINWAIINGETKTGVTTFFLDDKVDTGNIIFQEEVDINSDETAGDLHDKLMQIGANLVLKTVHAILNNNAPRIQQSDLKATPAPKIFKEHCKIDWNNPMEKIHNLIRGLSPYPAAFTTYKGKIIKIYKSEKTNTKVDLLPGSVLVTKEDLFVACNDSYLKIIELQLEGKKRLKTEEFLRGFNFQKEDALGS
ncbi:MAG TPA: methionyl-tRNA formyltransferase [Bacteroidota bacterium]|nr:methionyl-tRNA formyltransferase [Bacteroidota bacterium]